MSKRCPECGADNRDEAKLCNQCKHAFLDKAASSRLCAAGKHPLDPGWKTCPYCNQDAADDVERESPEKEGRRPTEMEGAAKGKDELPKIPPPPAGAKKRRETEFDANASKGPYQTHSEVAVNTSGRRIAGILVTYTWRPEGQVFAVREGRNILGADPECEISLRDDPQISGKHATIIYRGKGTPFLIDDLHSSNGTLVNGELILDNKLRMPNYSTIKTGATVWTFMIVEPEVSEEAQSK